MRLTRVLFLSFLITSLGRAQVDSLAFDPLPLMESSSSTRSMVVDMSNPDEVTLALRRIHTFRYLEALTLEGETEDKDLRKMFYRISSLKNLNALILKDNNLAEIPDNLATIKLLRSLTIEGNRSLNFDKLFQVIKPMKLSELRLVDNDLRSIPSSISEVKSLTKIQLSGSLQMNYEDFVNRLADLPLLTTLAIPLNYITEVPKNIDKLIGLQVLDVSNNSLSELPAEMSALKTINNLSIYGNLLVDPAKDLEKLKGNNIKYLALDKEISGEDLEQIKKAFPLAIVDFPINHDLVPQKITTESSEPIYSGEVKLKKEVRILSGAYLSYPSLFQGLIYRFDTLTFQQRFNDLRYVNVYETVPSSAGRRPGAFYLSKRAGYERRDRNETCFYFPFSDPLVMNNYPELRAFGGMYWVYRGPLTQKQFRKKYIDAKVKRHIWFYWYAKKTNRLWNDIRVDFDKNNSLFELNLKNDSGFVQFTAYPMTYGLSREKVMESYNRRCLLYKKSLQRRADRFNRELVKNRSRYDAAYKVMEDFAWRVLQRLMSNEERLMSRKQWLEYYDGLVANELAALDRSKPTLTFLSRAFTVREYKPTPFTAFTNTQMNEQDYGSRQVNIDFVDKDGGGKLAVKTILIVDNKKKTVMQTNGTLGLSPVTLSIHQFISCTMLVELRNGNLGVVVSDEIDNYNLERNKTYALRTIVFDRNLNTIGDILGVALK